MAIAGEIAYKITIDTNQLKTGLNDAEKAVEKSTSRQEKILQKLGDGAKKAGEALAGALKASAVAATTAVAGIATAAVKSYADYEQLTGGVETLFKSSSDTVMQYAQQAYKTAGLSANQYMETITGFSASLLQSLGGDTAKAAEVGNRAVQDMSDNANKMGTSIESIQFAYQGFAKQNYTMLDNLKLGYGGTKTEMERLISDAAKMKDVQKELNVTVDDGDLSFGNIVNAISVMQKSLDITGTTAKEADKTISGSFNSVKASWTNLTTAFADPDGDIDGAIENLITSVKNFGKNIFPAIQTALKGIAKALPEIVPVITEALPGLIKELLPPIIDATILIFEAIIEALPEILNALIEAAPVFIEAMKKIVHVIIEHLPEILGLLITGLVTAGAILLETILELVGEALAPIGDFFGAIFDEIGKDLASFGQTVEIAMKDIGKFFSDVWQGFQDGAKAAWEGIQSIFKNLADFFGNIFSKAWEAVKKVFSTGGKIFDGIKEGIVKAFKAVVNGIIDGINKVVSIPFNAINGVLDGIRSINILGVTPFTWIGRIDVPQIPHLATGGIVPHTAGGQIITAGEAGEDEWVVPESKMADMIAKLNESRTPTGNNITIQASGIWATNQQQKREVAMDIYKAIQDINKTRFGALGEI